MNHANEGTKVQLRMVSDDELEYRLEAWTKQEADLKLMSNDHKFSAKTRAAASQLLPWARAKRLQVKNEKEYRVLRNRIAKASGALEVFVSWRKILQPFVILHNMRLRKVQSTRETNNLKIKDFLYSKSGHFERMIALVAGSSATCE